MSKDIGKKAREQIARFLPDAIATAIGSYDKFMKEKPAEDVKSFAERHKACRVAVAHIELLLKLARHAELPSMSAQDQNSQILLAAMIQEAEDCLAGQDCGEDLYA